MFFLLFHVYNNCVNSFVMTALKSLSQNPIICVVLVLIILIQVEVFLDLGMTSDFFKIISCTFQVLGDWILF